MGINQLFAKHEKRLRLKHVQKRVWFEEIKFEKRGNAVFKVPPLPKNKKTFHWLCVPPTVEGEAPRPYTVKFTPHVGKRAKIPERMYNQKRNFSSRRDTRIAYSDAVFQPEKKVKDTDEDYTETIYNDPEYSEKQLREINEYETFFESWDTEPYTEEEKFELMQNAVNGRLEVYQELYKQTSNMLYLAQAVFIKFLDLETLSDLHRMYLILSEECEFPMCYVESVLRRHYSVLV